MNDLLKKFLECNCKNLDEFLNEEMSGAVAGGPQVSTSIPNTPEGSVKKVEIEGPNKGVQK